MTQHDFSAGNSADADWELQAVFRLAAVGMVQVDPQRGRFVRVNPKFCEITGYSESELLELTFADLTLPEDRAADLDHFARFVKGEIAEYIVEKRYVRRDGSVIWVSVNASMILDRTGEPLRTIAVISDVTSLRDTWKQEGEEELRRLHSSIFETIADATVVTAPDGSVLDWNPAAERLFGIRRNEIVGELAEVVLERVVSGATVRAEIERGLRLGRHWTGEIRVRQANGRERICEASVLPVDDASGNSVAHLHILRDVTIRRVASQRERMFSECLEASRTEIYLFDGETLRFQRVNRGARDNLGYSLEELRELTPLDLKPGFTEESFAELVAPLRAGESEMVRFESLHLRKDGSTYPADVHLQLFWTGERPIFVALILDTTERTGAERKARQAAERLRAVVATAVDGIITIGERGVIESANPAAERIFGYSEEELIGRDVSFLMPEPHRSRHGEYLAAYKATGERKIIGIGRELVGRRKDGSEFPLDLSVSESNIEGRRFFTGIVRDITDRKQAEEQERKLVREQAARVNAERAERSASVLGDVSNLLSSSLEPAETIRHIARFLVPRTADWCVIDLVRPSGGSETVQTVAAEPELQEALQLELSRFPHDDPDHPVGQVLETGTARLLQVTDSFLRTTARDDVHLEMRGLGQRSILIVPLTSRGITLGTATLARGPSRRPFQKADLMLATEIGRRAGLALDNARLHAAEQRAREQAESATRARDVLLGIVAHDLRSPLTSIQLFAAALGGSERSPAELRALDGIDRAVEQTDRLIQDLLEVSRLEAGALLIEPGPVRVEDLLQEVDETFGLKARQRGLGWAVEKAAAMGSVQADLSRLRQVLSNLLENALRFTSAGGHVRLRAERQGEEIVFCVADTGCGIAEADLPHLFDRFYQSRTTRSGGVGLGLTIARGLVEAHGGRIWAESQQGRGSTFRFTLPACADAEPLGVGEESRPPAAEEAPEAREVTKRVRILMVDDHPMILRGLDEILSGDPRYQIVGRASSGEEAIRIAEEESPDVVLMDLRMPGMDGIQATREITRMSDRVKVLALTADSEEESLLPLLAAGGNGYVWKTRAKEDLVTALGVVSRGEVFLYPSAHRLLLRGFQEAAQAVSHPLDTLSEQELEIVRLVAEGFTSREIGKQLFLSPHTVENYRSQLMRKLGLTHRTEVVQFALRTGLLAPE
jgi:PAS domain S-box-containing protein